MKYQIQLINLLGFIDNHKDIKALAIEIDGAKLKTGLLDFTERDKLLLTTSKLLTSIAKVCEYQYENMNVSLSLQKYVSDHLIFSELLKKKEFEIIERVVILEREEITELFILLLPYFEAYQPLCLCIESHDHDVFLSYNSATKLWQLSDIKDFDGESEGYSYSYDEQSLAEAITECFDDDETCLMKIKLICSSNIGLELINQFKASLTKFAIMDRRRAQMRNNDGLGLLHLEAQTGNIKEVTQLLNLDANPDHLSKTKNIGPIFVACENGHLDVVQKLIETKKIDLNRQANNGNSLLIAACYTKQWHVVDYLLNNTDIDINLQNNWGISALHLAVMSQDRKLCQLLIQKGAYVHALAPEFGTPLEAAELLENQALVNCLLPTSETLVHLPVKLPAHR